MDGPWGIGKSYYVKNILETKLKLDRKYTPIRISLFGLRSIDELKDKLLNEYIKERNEKISKIFNFKYIRTWFYLIISLSLILLNYLMNSFCNISSLEYSYIFKIFTNQCNNNTPNYIKVFGDILNYFHFIPEIYLWLYFLSKLPITKHFTDYIDHKYFGTSSALQKTEMKKLFPPERNILIFDDIERELTNNIKELLSFLNDLRENKGFNIIVIGNENELNGDDNYIKNYEKLEFQKIQFEYTQKRYENLKEYCLKQRNISGEGKIKLSKDIDRYISFASRIYYGYMRVNLVNLRIIKNMILSIINIEKQIFSKNIITTDDKLSNLVENVLCKYMGKREIIGRYRTINYPVLSEEELKEISDSIPEIKKEYVERALK